jgi:hypothetical protein
MSLRPTKEETQDAIRFSLALEDLIRLGQMLELALIPDLPRVSHARK